MKFALILLALGLTVFPALSQTLNSLEFKAYSDALNNSNIKEHFIGGLSGITYDSKSKRYFAITDNSSTRKNKSGTANIFSFDIFIEDQQTIKITDIEVSTLKDSLSGINPESIRVLNDGFLIADEGTTSTKVLTISKEGFLKEELYQTDEINFNSGFEGTSVSDDGKIAYFSMERPYGNSTVRGSTSESLGTISVFKFDIEGKSVIGQFIYPLHSPPENANLTESQTKSFKKDNGVTEILSFNDSTFLFLERAFLGGQKKKLHVRLYKVIINDQFNLLMGNFNPLVPELLFDFYQEDLPFEVDNIEGMTFSNDKKYLFLVSDDNFDNYGEQLTQIIALEIK